MKNVENTYKALTRSVPKLLKASSLEMPNIILSIVSKGGILRQKSIKRNGDIRYYNKLACKKCKCKCTISKFKGADFSKDDLIKAIDTHKKEDASNDVNANPKPPRTTV